MQGSFRFDFLVAATTAILSAAALFLIWEGRAGEEQERATGEMLAGLAARASTDGLIDEDRIELGVVANRLTGVPRVAGVAIFTVEDELLALSGTLEHGTPFVEPIVLDDTLLGYARISLVAPPAAPDPIRLGWTVLALVAIALLVAWWSARLRGGSHQPSQQTSIDPDSATEAVTRFLLVGNLHNQLSMSGSERRRSDERALAVARQVGEIYGCRSTHLPGTGLLMTFAAREDNDSAFEAVCAAFLIAERLAGDAATGRYRFGLHVVELQAGESPSDHPAALEDAALLAAMGKSGAIVASESFFARLAEPGRLEARAFSHPMLEQLHATSEQSCLITGLVGDHRALLEQQASHLAGDRGSN